MDVKRCVNNAILVTTLMRIINVRNYLRIVKKQTIKVNVLNASKVITLIKTINVKNYLSIVWRWTKTSNVLNVKMVISLMTIISANRNCQKTVQKWIAQENVPNVRQATILIRITNAKLFHHIANMLIWMANARNVNQVMFWTKTTIACLQTVIKLIVMESVHNVHQDTTLMTNTSVNLYHQIVPKLIPQVNVPNANQVTTSIKITNVKLFHHTANRRTWMVNVLNANLDTFWIRIITVYLQIVLKLTIMGNVSNVFQVTILIKITNVKLYQRIALKRIHLENAQNANLVTTWTNYTNA